MTIQLLSVLGLAVLAVAFGFIARSGGGKSDCGSCGGDCNL
jgi:hypothetical protein